MILKVHLHEPLDGLECAEKDEPIGGLVNLFLDVDTGHIQIDLEEILDGLAGAQSDLVGSKVEPAHNKNKIRA